MTCCSLSRLVFPAFQRDRERSSRNHVNTGYNYHQHSHASHPHSHHSHRHQGLGLNNLNLLLSQASLQHAADISVDSSVALVPLLSASTTSLSAATSTQQE